MLMGAGAIGAAAFDRTDSVTVGRSAKVPLTLVQTVQQHALPIGSSGSAFAPVFEMARNADFVLLGEASHGTHEFYSTRAQLTRGLIDNHGFNAVVIEGNWPDTARIDRYVRGGSPDTSAEQALAGFHEFPDWMWRNTDVRDFVAWLQQRNAALPDSAVKTGFYGMDLYSLIKSRDAVLQYLESVEPLEFERAADRYRRLQKFSDPQTYGAAAVSGWRTSAAKGANRQFEDMTGVVAARINSQDPQIADAAFHAHQHARIVRNAEQYYREMYAGNVNTWNIRDRHMADTIDAIADHLRKRDGHARIVVWAHNSHVGDARATAARWRGEWNVGQLVRERHPGKTVLVGFSTSTGTVMASSNWGEPGVVKRVQPAMPRSYERAFQESGIPAFVLPLRHEPVAREFRRPLLQRAIGVIYLPQTERQSHYFEASLARQFDAIVHIDRTRAVQPLGDAARNDAARQVPVVAGPAEAAAEVHQPAEGG
jgi:erythromycin esterase-like protein